MTHAATALAGGNQWVIIGIFITKANSTNSSILRVLGFLPFQLSFADSRYSASCLLLIFFFFESFIPTFIS
jgi:hypothetical protein